MWNQLPCHGCTSPYLTNGRPSPIDVYVMINHASFVYPIFMYVPSSTTHIDNLFVDLQNLMWLGQETPNNYITSAAHLSTAWLGHFMFIENYGYVKCPRLALQLTYPGVSLYFCATRCFSEVQDLEFSPVSTVQMRWFLPSDLGLLKMGDLQTIGFPTNIYIYIYIHKWDNSWALGGTILSRNPKYNFLQYNSIFN